MSKASDCIKLFEKKVQATVLFFDTSSGEGSVRMPDGNRYDIKLPIHGNDAKKFDFSKIKEGSKVSVEVNPKTEDIMKEYGMVTLVSNN